MTNSSVGSSCPTSNPTPASDVVNVSQTSCDQGDYHDNSHLFKRFVPDVEKPLFKGVSALSLSQFYNYTIGNVGLALAIVHLLIYSRMLDVFFPKIFRCHRVRMKRRKSCVI